MTENLSPSMQQQAESRIDGMEWLFSQLFGLYGNPFLDKFRSGHVVNGKDTGIENAKGIWRQKITENQLTAKDVKRGVDGCNTLKFPPSWAEFLAVCKPNIDPTFAYYEAVAGSQARKAGEHGEWSHPAIYWASVPLSFELLTLGYSQIKVRWERALADQLGKGQWPEIPQPALALPEPGKSIASTERAQQEIEKLSTSMRMHGSGKDPKAWALRILDREKHGDKNLSALQVRFAREAMYA